MTKKEQVHLSDKEMAEVQRLARQTGLTEDEAATQIVTRELARRMKKRGRASARVYSLRRR